jgi:hypothetical protein
LKYTYLIWALGKTFLALKRDWVARWKDIKDEKWKCKFIYIYIYISIGLIFDIDPAIAYDDERAFLIMNIIWIDYTTKWEISRRIIV